MYLYDKFFGDYDKTVAQILLNADDIEEEKKENLINTFNALLEMGVIPIVNENDSVSYKEIESRIVSSVITTCSQLSLQYSVAQSIWSFSPTLMDL